MNIDDLRRKNKQVLVDHAFVIYCIDPEYSLRKSEWVNYLVNGGNFELMLEKLKSGRSLVMELTGRESRIYGDLLSAIRMRGVA